MDYGVASHTNFFYQNFHFHTLFYDKCFYRSKCWTQIYRLILLLSIIYLLIL